MRQNNTVRAKLLCMNVGTCFWWWNQESGFCCQIQNQVTVTKSKIWLPWTNSKSGYHYQIQNLIAVIKFKIWWWQWIKNWSPLPRRVGCWEQQQIRLKRDKSSPKDLTKATTRVLTLLECWHLIFGVKVVNLSPMKEVEQQSWWKAKGGRKLDMTWSNSGRWLSINQLKLFLTLVWG